MENSGPSSRSFGEEEFVPFPSDLYKAAKNKAAFHEVMRALGHVTASFNWLEQELTFALIHLIAPRDFVAGRLIARQRRGFQQLAGEVVDFFELYFNDATKRQALREKIKEAKRLSGRRDTLVHSVWYLSDDDGKPAIRFKETKDTTEERLEAKDLFQIAEEIDNCTADLSDFFVNNLRDYEGFQIKAGTE